MKPQRLEHTGQRARGTKIPKRLPSALESGILNEDSLALALANPQATFDRIAKKKCEESFLSFVELFWPVIDPAQPFVRSHVQEAIADHLEAVHRGDILKLLINVPPGTSKSRLCNVFFAAWEWGPKKRPDLRYASWSYSIALTKRDNDDCRKIIRSALYQRLWGQCAKCRKRKEEEPRCKACEKDRRFRLEGDTNSKILYANDWKGFRFASSVGGGGTGHRVDRLIFDDPHNVKQAESDKKRQETIDWFAGTLPTRVRNADGSTTAVELPPWVKRAHEMNEDDDQDSPIPSATIGIMQRLELEDVSGVILKTPALNYTHLLIEMEYEGDTHEARKFDEEIGRVPLNERPGYVDFRKPRSLVQLGAANDNEVLARVGLQSVPELHPEGDEWGAFCDLFVRIGFWAWQHLADPIRFPKHVVEDLRASLALKHGSDAAAAQLQQWPQEVGGSFFPSEAVTVLSRSELLEPRAGYKTRGWDLAGTDDDAAAATVGVLGYIDVEDRIIIEDVVKTRSEPTGVDALILATAKEDDVSGYQVVQDFPRDPGQAGKYQMNAFAKLLHGMVFTDSPEGKAGKVARARPLSSQWKQGGQAEGKWRKGNVYMVEGPWNAEYKRIMSRFPVSREKDEIDATTRMYDAQVQAEPVQVIGAPKVIKLR